MQKKKKPPKQSKDKRKGKHHCLVLYLDARLGFGTEYLRLQSIIICLSVNLCSLVFAIFIKAYATLLVSNSKFAWFTTKQPLVLSARTCCNMFHYKFNYGNSKALPPYYITRKMIRVIVLARPNDHEAQFSAQKFYNQVSTM